MDRRWRTLIQRSFLDSATWISYSQGERIIGIALSDLETDLKYSWEGNVVKREWWLRDCVFAEFTLMVELGLYRLD